MRQSNENLPCVIRPSNIDGAVKPETGNRRALSRIDVNIKGYTSYRCDVEKRGFSKQGNVAANKNPAVHVHRPVTRKFAAQLAGKRQQPPLKDSNASIKPNLTTHGSDCIIIDASNYKPKDGHDEPMFVQHTEAMLEEIYRMQDAEVEMEDVEDDEQVLDIDSCDKMNPLAVTEYIDDIYAHYKKSESLSCVPPNYMEQQSDINERMRGILIDWLIEVHYKFELMDETLYLTVNLIDRFLAVESVVRKKLQLVGVTALLLACKYEEVSVPVVEDLILISDKAYCRKEVLAMEKLMVNALQFNLSVPTPYVFMKRFLKAAQSDKKLELVSFFIMDLCLVEIEMLKFPPSLLAAAAVFAGQCTLNGSKQWSKTSEKHTNYTENQLLECAKFMVSFHKKSGSAKLTAVLKKYSTSKYGYAAKLEPAAFLIDV